jgi:hypothetical protein
VGDYAKDDDLAPEHNASTIYTRCGTPEFTDISELVVTALQQERVI